MPKNPSTQPGAGFQNGLNQAAEPAESPVANAQVLHLVQFEFDSAQITAAEAEALNRLAEELEEVATTRLWLRGFTDDIGPDGYNHSLAQRRIESVIEHLNELELAVAGYEALGNCCYVATNETSAGRAQNRRVEVFLFTEGD